MNIINHRQLNTLFSNAQDVWSVYFSFAAFSDMLALLNSLRIFLPPLFKCNFVYLFIIYISLTFIDVLLYLFRVVQAGCRLGGKKWVSILFTQGS